MDTALKVSYRECERITRERAGNFYYAFTVLPKAKRQAIFAMYAFMRYCDDISDSDKPAVSKVDALMEWREALRNALQGSYGGRTFLPAFRDAVRTFDIPEKYFHELIDGAAMDLSIKRYETFEELYEYCYRVASVVGLVCIHIFGFRDEIAKKYAEYNGIAFQMTNILRDVREDAERNRIYLPMEDLRLVGYSEEELLNGELNDGFRRLMKLEVDRAREYYRQGTPLIDHVDTGSRAGLMAMVGIYSSLLDRIEQRDYDVFSHRVALSTKEKLRIAARSVLCMRGNGKEAATTAV